MVSTPQCRKPIRKLLCFFISRAGRSHAPMLRPSSSHELDNILISLEFPVSILFRVRRFHPYPRHFFNFYVTHGSPFGFFSVRYAISPIWSCGGALYQYRAFFILHCCYANAQLLRLFVKFSHLVPKEKPFIRNSL